MSCKTSELYVCACEGEKKCDAIVEMVVGCEGDCEVSCCGAPMKPAEPKTADQGKEKHVPVIERIEGGYRVKVGDVPHPMLEEHHIQFIELRTCCQVHRKYLKPGDAPEAVFMMEEANVTAIENCNIHGLWTS